METAYIKSTDGYELCLNIYEAENPKGYIQIIHGMEEHQGRYSVFAEMLVSQGYTVISSDMRGHGATAPLQGFFAEKDGYKLLLEDQKNVTAYIKQRFGADKIIVFAHSMGSIIARNLLHTESENYKKVILSGYPYCPAIIHIAILLSDIIMAFRGPRYVSGWMQKLALGDFNRSMGETETEFDWLSADKENVQSYINDPLCGHIFTISAFGDLFRLLRDMNKTELFKNVQSRLPILALRGENDPSTGLEKGSTASTLALSRAGFSNIRRNVYKGMRHEIINETDKAKVYKDILAFLKE